MKNMPDLKNSNLFEFKCDYCKTKEIISSDNEALAEHILAKHSNWYFFKWLTACSYCSEKFLMEVKSISKIFLKLEKL
ncbi:MAG: hypothetical protein BV456_00670 [Thermoplasmata archaeon M8B2D]|nr:MAG: hypothetical protein BV456_00670 [Thermoplasmata archaeon M8B2D]